jgi:uncharacterized protein YecT (DUF1311 family)
MRRLALLAALALAPLPAYAQTADGCDPAKLQGGELAQCLAQADRASASALDAAYKAALDSIATRPGVFDAQRARWRNSLTESQEIWLHFRNVECQNVAPFEGQASTVNVSKNRVSIYEAKTQCTIRMNEARAADLAARYPKP